MPRIQIGEVYCHDYRPDQGATYVRLDNLDRQPASLAGWVLELDGHPVALPPGAALPPLGSLYVARDGAAFRREMARDPEYTLLGPGADALGGAQPPPPFRPEGGQVRLLDPAGQVASALVWGSATPAGGWEGPPVPAPPAGVVLRRAVDEATITATCCGRSGSGTGTAADWRQGQAWMDLRVARAGQVCFPYPTFAAHWAVAFVAPDASFAAVRQFIEGAQSALEGNVYYLTHEGVAGALRAALGRRVAVRLLLEGEPEGGIPRPERDIALDLAEAGARVQVLRSAADGYKRYRFTHAKYAIADGQRVLVMSDNWTNHSLPHPPGTGQRGWGVVLGCRPLAAYLTRVLAADANPAFPDTVPVNRDLPAVDFPPDRRRQAPYTPRFVSVRVAGPIRVTPVLAPDHSLLLSKGIIGLMRAARHSLDIQQKSVPVHWGPEPGGSPAATPNLYLAEVLAAARRGVRVRLILGGGWVRPSDPYDNLHTREYVNDLARREGLPLEARLDDPEAAGITTHNKGIIADGRWVFVGSINWTQNSPLNNRELGIILDSPALAAYYGRVFEHDWARSR